MVQADAMAKAQSNHGTRRRDEVFKAGKVRKAKKLAKERWIKRTSLSLKMPQPTKNGSGDEAHRWNRAQARQLHNKMAAENLSGFLPPRSASWAWTSRSVRLFQEAFLTEILLSARMQWCRVARLDHVFGLEVCKSGVKLFELLKVIEDRLHQGVDDLIRDFGICN